MSCSLLTLIHLICFKDVIVSNITSCSEAKLFGLRPTNCIIRCPIIVNLSFTCLDYLHLRFLKILYYAI